MNLGQLALLVRAKYLVDAFGYNQVRGLPFRAEELADVLEHFISEVSATDDGNDAVDTLGVDSP
jgi:2-oxoglutarate ferredoxin oxidoreductase subunit alpha